MRSVTDPPDEPARPGAAPGIEPGIEAGIGPGRAGTAADERLSLLVRVSEALLSTDDPDEAVGRLARVVVPELADWSFITVVDEDGNLRDIGLAHRDPAHEDDLVAYSACHLEDMTDVAAVSVGLRTGEPVVVPHLSDAVLATFLPDPQVAYLTRRLDPHGVAVFPLRGAGRTFGVLVSVTMTGRGSHTADELSTLHEVARRAGPVLAAARAARRARTLAETMQRSLLAVSPAGAGLEAAVRYRPAYLDREVGGDWYDVFTLDDGCTAVSIGDVMGHDLTAIAAMAQLRSFMRANAWNLRHSPAEILGATDAVSFGLGPGSFATALTAEFGTVRDDGSTEVRWSNAGHPPPLVLGADGAVSWWSDPGGPDMPLGVRRGAVRHDRHTTLPPGSIVLFYTDGLIERREQSVDEGLARLVDVLRTLPVDDLELLLDDLLATMVGDGAQPDDIALVAVRTAADRR